MRSKELDNTAIPSEYEIYATLKTEKYNEAERVIHNFVKKLNPDLRIRKNREFFNIKPENAAEILEDVSELLDDSEVEYWSNGKIVVSTEKQKRKVGKRFSIYEK
ncbi:MAG: GIY-YIG nuclease family protein [Candidatus Peribacteria bacterium]|nr:GIY-YIG nuclease family protein [Candidatus Peribacteria bacterium]